MKKKKKASSAEEAPVESRPADFYAVGKPPSLNTKRRVKKTLEPGANKRQRKRARRSSLKYMGATAIVVYMLGTSVWIIKLWRESKEQRRALRPAPRAEQLAMGIDLEAPPDTDHMSDRMERIEQSQDAANEMRRLLETDQLKAANALMESTWEWPSTDELVLQRARLLSRTQRPRKALKEYWMLVERRPDDARLWEEILNLCRVTNLQELRLRSALWLLSVDPSDKDLHLDVAQAYCALKRPTASVEHYEEYLLEHPLNKPARMELADLYIQEDQPAKARRLIERLLEIGPPEAPLYRMLLKTQIAMDDRAGIFETVRRSEKMFGKKEVNAWLKESDMENAAKLIQQQQDIARDREIDRRLRMKQDERSLMDLQLDDQYRRRDLFKE